MGWHDDVETLLLAEVIPAMGCTEPIAIALAAAKAREVLGQVPAELRVEASANVVKNAMCVTIPHSGGRSGIPVAAALGATGGDPDQGLNCLATATPDEGTMRLAERVEVAVASEATGLVIRVQAVADGHRCEVELVDDHSRFHRIERDGIEVVSPPPPNAPTAAPVELTVESILTFADDVDLEARGRLASLLDAQADANLAVSEAGLREAPGAGVGATLAARPEPTVADKARAAAAGASDARMAGLPLPVYINAGSGNQGITVAVPVAVYAEEVGASRDELRRALIVANLIGLYQKRYVGKLAAFCGAVTAAAAAGAGIGRLAGLNHDQIGLAVSNSLATATGVVCDGAKASCAGKVSLAVDNALAAVAMATQGRAFPFAQGIVGDDVDATIRNVGRIASQGMRQTDEEILDLMLAGCRSSRLTD